jgi:hypothetical protein
MASKELERRIENLIGAGMTPESAGMTDVQGAGQMSE